MKISLLKQVSTTNLCCLSENYCVFANRLGSDCPNYQLTTLVLDLWNFVHITLEQFNLSPSSRIHRAFVKLAEVIICAGTNMTL